MLSYLSPVDVKDTKEQEVKEREATYMQCNNLALEVFQRSLVESLQCDMNPSILKLKEVF